MCLSLQRQPVAKENKRLYKASGLRVERLQILGRDQTRRQQNVSGFPFNAPNYTIYDSPEDLKGS